MKETFKELKIIVENNKKVLSNQKNLIIIVNIF
jgi:hypothetical protein